MVGREELPLLLLLQIQVMVQAAQEILLRVLLQRQHHKPQHLRECLLVLLLIAVHDGEVLLLPFPIFRSGHHICQGQR